MHQLAAFLSQPLPGKIPVSAIDFQALRKSDLYISDSFEEYAHPDHELSQLVVSVLRRTPRLGGEPMTAAAVDRTLLAMLIGIDEIVPQSSNIQVNFHPQRDQADSTSQMTLQSATGSSLRPDLQLRAEDQIRLLFKGEEKGSGHNLAEALQVCASSRQAMLLDQLSLHLHASCRQASHSHQWLTSLTSLAF